MKKSCKLTTVLIIVSLILVLTGCLLEKSKAEKSVREYVLDTYGFTATQIVVHFSIDGLKYATVSIEEMPFSFDVFINSDHEAYGDMYIDALAEHTIEEIINESAGASGGNIKFDVYLEHRLTDKYNGITAEEILTDPKKIFDAPQTDYRLIISGVEYGSDTDYKMFKEIAENYNPTEIEINYTNNESVKMYAGGIQSLINCFPEFISADNTVNCCWTYSSYNSDARIGPSTYHMEGFIDITDTELEHLLEKYEFTESELAVDELLQPYLSEYENVKWCYSKELSYDIKKSNFVGHFYLDVNNGLYYFELDSN